MTRKARLGAALLAAALTAAVLAGAGCTPKGEEKLAPQVKPPAIASAGVFTVGVDLRTPPFAGTDAGRKAGFDIDVAAAVAERLGLSVAYVNVKPSDAATALAAGKVDAVMSVPLNTASLTSLSLAGSYAVDGPAFFISTDSTASIEPSLTLDTLKVPKVGAQRGSESYWYLRSELGSDSVVAYDSLREAIDALDSREIPVICGDLFVGAYIARDLGTVHFAGQPKPASPLCVAVSQDNTALEGKIRSALDALAADGVFDALRRKWIGDTPELKHAEPSGQTTATP